MRIVHVPKPDVVHTTLLLFLVRTVNVAKLDVVYTTLRFSYVLTLLVANHTPLRFYFLSWYEI